MMFRRSDSTILCHLYLSVTVLVTLFFFTVLGLVVVVVVVTFLSSGSLVVVVLLLPRVLQDRTLFELRPLRMALLIP